MYLPIMSNANQPIGHLPFLTLLLFKWGITVFDISLVIFGVLLKDFLLGHFGMLAFLILGFLL